MNANPILNESCLEKHLRRCVPNERFKFLAAIAALGIVFIFLVAGCQTTVEPYSPKYGHVDLFPAYTNVLDQADTISITFRYSTNFNTIQKIGLDGMVNLEGVGELKVEGKTVAGLQNELTRLYQSQVKDDPVTVKIVAPAAAIYVTGAVNRPGKIPMDRRMTVVDAIAEAGGFDQYRAKLSKVSVLRVEGDTQRIYWLNVNRILAGEEETPFYLKPFDIVRVPTKTFNF